MWIKGRFSHTMEFITKANELGFTHIEANASISPQVLDELIKSSIPISSIHSPCPAVLSSKGVPVASLSLSSLDENEREEAVSFARKTIDFASIAGAKAVVLHMGKVQISLRSEDNLRLLYESHLTQTEEYNQLKEELINQRTHQSPPYFEAAQKSLRQISQYSQQQDIILGLETRFYHHEIPNLSEMAELLNGTECSSVGYWHDIGHAEVQQRLGFCSHEKWLSHFEHKIIGIHLHDVLGLSDHQPPGKGIVNWSMVTKYLPREAIKVCEIAEWNEEDRIQGVVDFLRKEGVLS